MPPASWEGARACGQASAGSSLHLIFSCLSWQAVFPDNSCGSRNNQVSCDFIVAEVLMGGAACTKVSVPIDQLAFKCHKTLWIVGCKKAPWQVEIQRAGMERERSFLVLLVAVVRWHTKSASVDTACLHPSGTRTFMVSAVAFKICCPLFEVLVVL